MGLTDGLKKQHSLPQRRGGFGVAASPFNAVKFDLAVILIVGVLLLLVHGAVVANFFGQLLLLGGYGIVAMVWLMVKTQRVLRAHQRDAAIADE